MSTPILVAKGKAPRWFGVCVLGTVLAAACSGGTRHRSVKEESDAGADAAAGGTAGSNGNGGTAGGGGIGAGGGALGGAGGTAASGGTASLDAGADASSPGTPDASVDATTRLDGSTSDAAAPRALYVNGTTGDDTSSGFPGSPYRTLGHAFASAAPGDTVWLQDGAFTVANDGGFAVGRTRTLPAGVNLRAVTDGQVTVEPAILLGGGTQYVEGIEFAPGGGYNALTATTGNITLSRVKVGASGGAGTCTGALRLSGDAKVRLDSGGDPAFDYTTAVVNGFATLIGSAELTVVSGTIDGATNPGCSPGATIVIAGTAKLTFSGVTMINGVQPYFLVNQGGELSLLAGTKLDTPTTTQNYSAVWIGEAAAATKLTIQDSSISGAFPAAIRLDTGIPVVTLTNATISNTGQGILVPTLKLRGGAATAAPVLTMTGSTISGNANGGICWNEGGTLDISDSVISGNGATAATYLHCGGLGLMGAMPYLLSLRNTQITGNTRATPPATFAGVRVEGDATSVYDLGTTASPGGNTFTGNAATGVRVLADATVQVHASGNTWTPSTQGTDAAGLFALGTAPCGAAAPCTVTTGSGLNYVVSTGSLSLVE